MAMARHYGKRIGARNDFCVINTIFEGFADVKSAKAQKQ